MKWLKNIIYKAIRKIICSSMPELYLLYNKDLQDIGNSGLRGRNFDWSVNRICCNNTHLSLNVKLYPPYSINDSNVDCYTYVAPNARISKTEIGRFCSIGPNLLCGWGIHPTDAISTSPMFYSTLKQNGITFSSEDKIEERKSIKIGNDVFIGANVTILDGVVIGDGAVIGAGAVVSKDIPPYAIAVGCPIKVIRYRFTDEQITKLLKISWWNFEEKDLKDVEKMFFDVDRFIDKYSLKQFD